MDVKKRKLDDINVGVQVPEKKLKLKESRRKKDKPVLQLDQLPLRQLCLFNYYKRILKNEPHIADMLYGIDVHRNPISNRGLEHLATNYSRKYDLRIDENGEDSDLGEFYVADPCCRGPLIAYSHKGRLLKTTIPQIGSNISLCRSPCIKYAEKNSRVIRKDLNIDKKIPQIKPTPDIILPVKKPRSIHQMIPRTIKVEL
jgi:hypothetical protein